jgi:hypothetical protein
VRTAGSTGLFDDADQGRGDVLGVVHDVVVGEPDEDPAAEHQRRVATDVGEVDAVGADPHLRPHAQAADVEADRAQAGLERVGGTSVCDPGDPEGASAAGPCRRGDRVEEVRVSHSARAKGRVGDRQGRRERLDPEAADQGLQRIGQPDTAGVDMGARWSVLPVHVSLTALVGTDGPAASSSRGTP